MQTTTRAAEIFTEAGGDPANAADLEHWARAQRDEGDPIRAGVLVTQDGRLIAETRRIGPLSGPGVTAYYVIQPMIDGAEELKELESGLAAGRAQRLAGQPVVHLKASEVCQRPTA